MAGAAPEPFAIPSPVACSDGPCGELVRVVLDPVVRTVTHLVIEPRHPDGPAKLVSLDLVVGTARVIRLRCSRKELDALEDVREVDFVQPGPDDSDYGPEHSYTWPYYGLAYGGMGTAGMGSLEPPSRPHQPHRVSHDRIPLGEVEVRRGERVFAQDGPIGHVQGLVIDPADHHVTHVLLQEGHLWGTREVAIPIRSVTGIEDGIRVDLTKEEIAALPPVPIDHPGAAGGS